jgi:hypothetical protein
MNRFRVVHATSSIETSSVEEIASTVNLLAVLLFLGVREKCREKNTDSDGMQDSNKRSLYL